MKLTITQKAKSTWQLWAGRATQAARYVTAKITRLTSDFFSPLKSEDQELRHDLRVLRANARKLAHDRDHMKRFLQLVENNVIGPEGIQLQVRAATPDGTLLKGLNQKIQNLWWEWGNDPDTASANSRMNWPAIQRLFARTLARDGEVLCRMVPVKNNPFGVSVHFYSVDWLDETYNTILANGNRVIMSVEMDEFDRPVAFWFTPPATEKFYRQQFLIDSRQRIEADEIIHAFIVTDATQSRGIPWSHTCSIRLNHVGGYEESEAVRARGGAAWLGFYKKPGEGYTGATTQTQLLQELEPGTISELPAGWDFIANNPSSPNPIFGDFMKHQLRSISAGLGVNYNSLAGDLESVNYSSYRAGSLQEQDHWRIIQAFIATHFCNKVYKIWLRYQLLNGTINEQEFELAQSPLWRPRAWLGVDPEKDQQAHVVGLQNYLTTYTDVVEGQGKSLEDVFAQRKAEKDMAAQYGLTLPY